MATTTKVLQLIESGQDWDTIKQHLPTTTTTTTTTTSQLELIDESKRSKAINQYCSLPNATLSTLKELLVWSPDFEPSPELMDHVSFIGNIDILQYLHTRYPDIVCSVNAMDLACQAGKLDVVKFLHFNRLEGCTKRAMDRAIENNHQDIITFLKENRTEGASKIMTTKKESQTTITTTTTESSSSSSLTGIANEKEGNLEEFKRLLKEQEEEGGEVELTKKTTEKTLLLAASKGNIDIVKYIIENKLGKGEVRDTKIMEEAFRGEHWQVVELLLEHGWELGMEEIHMAVIKGNLSWVQRIYPTLIGNNVPWKTVDDAAAYGHLDILKFFYSEGFRLCRQVDPHNGMALAAENGHLACVEFIHSRNPDVVTTDAMDLAAKNGHLSIVSFLHRNRKEGCTQKALEAALSNGHLSVAKYLVENGLVKQYKSMNNRIIKNGWISILKFVHKHFPESINLDRVKEEHERSNSSAFNYLQSVGAFNKNKK
ncbi:hypothetical protein DFA_02773 [Cavenderia fasciculata]|uniref:Ankyrin repeat-containing protein n=1 Tax=Cavenderia fasciculata TaxID=261658 RepID=F4PI96_CACFS|nr:uncharacterized protein DFA_02773 [Cavenderia fasciculata]EGG24530.1 hypothetical protein DFA_02773 [Cavenderia fasciculata]|eukprot:XP_004362381.1 hypothetical protein DFA_02773 [Cavenderia fasciculata]